MCRHTFVVVLALNIETTVLVFFFFYYYCVPLVLIVLNCGEHFVHVNLCWLIVMIEVCISTCLSNTYCYRILIPGETPFLKQASLAAVHIC